MGSKIDERRVSWEDLRWRLDPSLLSFKTTDELEPLKDIIGQDRGVEAFRFGMRMSKSGYNVFVTGRAGTGRLATVKKMLHELSKEEKVPDDLCYVNNFKNQEEPILLRLKGGTGLAFKTGMASLVEKLKKEIPQVFESQEYINFKKEIMEAYENKGKGFFKALDQRVKQEGFALVDIQVGQYKRPEVMPIVDGQPMHLDQVEQMVEKGRFPKDEFEAMRDKQTALREQIDQIFLELRDLQKEVQEKIEEMDRVMFMKTATELAAPMVSAHKSEAVAKYVAAALEDMASNLAIFRQQGQPVVPGMPVMFPEADPFQPYQVNLLVDNSERKGPPVIIEEYPTYRNIFGSIERIVDRSGLWRTDFSRIKAGSLVKANGGYLVINLLDAIMEPGVWPGLKRALKSRRLEIQTYDPFYLFTTSGLKPEPIELDTKVVVIADEYLYHLLLFYDQDVGKIFKVRADFDTSMDKNETTILQLAAFVRMKTDEEKLLPLSSEAFAELTEEAVRMTGRQEKISTSFPAITDIVREADYWARQEGAAVTESRHVQKALQAKIYRSNLIEEHIQEMIDRGTLMIDLEGEVVGQVNGLAVYTLGDYVFGKPSRITASTSMGRAGIINIEREADLSGSTHNKGVLILGGYLRKKYAQDKPLTMSASLAFEQSYSGVDGDSASSTEIYAILSSLSEIPIRQYIAVTGSVNQKGEVQAIGGVNQKIEGFFDTCKKKGLTGKQGVMIPESNLKDLMLRKDVVEAVKEGRFHIYSVRTIDEGIEILTGRPAGERGEDGSYPEGSVNFLVDKKLKEFAKGLKEFGEEEGEEKKRQAKRKKGDKK
jgi:ATP-dependent Lon protease